MNPGGIDQPGDPFAAWGSDVHVIAEAGSLAPAPVPAGAKSPRGLLAVVGGLALGAAAVIRMLGSNLSADSSSYRIGAWVGTIAVVVAAGALVAWGFRRIRSGEHNQTVANIGAPRWARIAIITILVLFVGGVFLSVVVGPGSQASASWSSPQGVNDQAGFMSGCQQSGGTTADCQCLFNRLAADPQYNTPAKFETLDAAAEQYKQTGNRAYIPAVYVESAQVCLASTSSSPSP